MKYVVKPNQTTLVPTTEQAPALGDLPDFDIEKLLAHSGEILRREIANLLGASSRGKLDGASARDLVAYIRLLQEIKTAKEKELGDLTDDELRALAAKT